MALFGGVKLVGRPDLENVRRLDLLPMSAIQEMMNYGFAVDRDHLRDVGAALGKEMEEIRIEICSYIPPEKLDEFISRSNLDSDEDYLPMNVDSNKQLCELLFSVLGIGKDKRLKRTKSGDQISTGRRQLEQLRLEHPVIGKTLAYRERAKLKNTYADQLPKLAVHHPQSNVCPVCGLKHDADTYRVHTEVLSTRTKTGRYASKNPNLQNVSIRSNWGKEIRRGFIASPGTKLCGCDFSQIEMRMLAYLGHVDRMAEMFRKDQDVHTQTAMLAFDLPEEKIDKLIHRTPAKNVGFGVVYGESPLGLYEQLVSDTYGKQGIPIPSWLTLDWCESFLKKWFKIYPEVVTYMEKQSYRAYRYGIVWDLFGRIRQIPEVQSVHKKVVQAGLRQAGNMPIQGVSAELIKLALAEVQLWIETEIRPSGIWCQPLITVHDEGIWEVEEDYAELFKSVVEEIFGRVLTDHDTGEDLCSVPIKAEGVVMDRWEKG